MTREEFNECVNGYTAIAQQQANNFLKQFGLTLSVNWGYDFDDEDWEDCIGVYESGSVFDGCISIGMNINTLYKAVSRNIKQWQHTSPYTLIKEAICTNVYHEMGHGIVERIEDYVRCYDDLDELYDENKQLFDKVLDNEEESVEEFAWDFYDNQLENSDLYQIIQLCSKIL